MRYALLLTIALIGCTKAPTDDSLPVSAERGKRFAEQNSCLACHATETVINKAGPSWKGIYGNPVILNNGKSVVANKQYIFESILRPNAKIVKGFSPVMPAYRPSTSDLESVALYIKSLK